MKLCILLVFGGVMCGCASLPAPSMVVGPAPRARAAFPRLDLDGVGRSPTPAIQMPLGASDDFVDDCKT